MTTLVTGGTGFAGAATVRELARRGERIAVLSRDASSVAERFPGLDVEARAGDVRDPSTLTPAFAGIETVINCVQFPNSPIENRRKGWTFEQIDYLGTAHQVEAARAAGVPSRLSNPMVAMAAAPRAAGSPESVGYAGR